MIRLLVLSTMLLSVVPAQACYVQSDTPGKPLCGGGYSEGRQNREDREAMRRLVQTQQEILDLRRGLLRPDGRFVDENGYDGVPPGYTGDEP